MSFWRSCPTFSIFFTWSRISGGVCRKQVKLSNFEFLRCGRSCNYLSIFCKVNTYARRWIQKRLHIPSSVSLTGCFFRLLTGRSELQAGVLTSLWENLNRCICWLKYTRGIIFDIKRHLTNTFILYFAEFNVTELIQSLDWSDIREQEKECHMLLKVTWADAEPIACLHLSKREAQELIHWSGH